MTKPSQVTRRAAITAAATGVAMAAGSAAMAQEGAGQAMAAARAAKEQAKAAAERSWRAAGPFSSAEEAAAFLNVDPAQGPGEAGFCCMDGQFHVFWYF